MFNFNKNHRNLALVSLAIYAGLSILIAVVPAYKMQSVQPLPSMKPLTDQEMRGLKIYVSENCMACHTQQVRNIEMDEMWGKRPSIPSDYYYSKKRLDFWRQSPSLLGSERTGPDLTNIGNRQSGKEWHLLHLFNPRSVVKASVMPSYKWLFEEKDPKSVTSKDVVLSVPKEFMQDPNKKVVATQKALDLVAYLISLKQPEIGDAPKTEFIPAKKKEDPTAALAGGAASNLPDGNALFMNTCSACHQADGKGIAGAFPPLAGSDIVNDPSPDKMIHIVLQGYDARAEYGVMPPFADQLTDEEIAAIITHERSSWGNQASAVTPEDVKKIRDLIGTQNQ